MSYHLIDVLQQLGQPRLLVIGDLILDRYVWGEAERVSQEAPVILLRQESDEMRLGGAANVANMIRGLDADVTIAGVIGRDSDGEELQASLANVGVDCSTLLVDESRPTTVKVRFIGKAQSRHPHQILRVDRESRHALPTAIEDEFLTRVLARLDGHQAVLISDYSKGVCTPRVLRTVIDAAKERGIPVLVDPGPKANFLDYVGATAVTPNRLETKLATGCEVRSADDAFVAGRQLVERLQLQHAFVTLDKDGIALALADGSHELFPTRKREVYDITGAGDMVLAMIGVGLADGLSPQDLCRLANVAGGLEVERIGVVAITRQEILGDLLGGSRKVHEKVSSLNELARMVDARKQLGQKVVFTNGCFDLLHAGHVQYLQEAATLGDCLIVALNSDDSTRRLKGPTRPVISQEQRSMMLAALECVDHAIVFEEDTPLALLQRLQPHILAKGGTTASIVGREFVESYGGEVRLLSEVPNVSTSRIVSQIRTLRDAA
ncbi:MAG: PfkB family carbohydrate kinase [Planctomycetaceae bacterium]